MILVLHRIYYPQGTNGQLCFQGKKICETIELPWLNNQRHISCVPEGEYELTARVTKARGKHLQVKNVPQRSLILIHPANDAKKELLGCIAPVTNLTGPGTGTESRKAMKELLKLINNQSQVFLIIQS
ncbi:MAG TPA: DUF5675 family protein [Sphingobacteriaceae bacterium]